MPNLSKKFVGEIKILFQLAVDNGGGMNPDKMRQCMSLGYSAKSKIADTIGQCKSYLRSLLFQILVGLSLQRV